MWQHVAGGQGEWEYLPLRELEGAEVSVAAAPLESALVTTIATLRAGGGSARCGGATSTRCAR